MPIVPRSALACSSAALHTARTTDLCWGGWIGACYFFFFSFNEAVLQTCVTNHKGTTRNNVL